MNERTLTSHHVLVCTSSSAHAYPRKAPITYRYAAATREGQRLLAIKRKHVYMGYVDMHVNLGVLLVKLIISGKVAKQFTDELCLSIISQTRKAQVYKARVQPHFQTL